jgi:NADH-quinone oxidoreductase subunit H
MLLFFTLSNLIELIFSIIFIILILLSVAFTTLSERKLMGALQRRMGPNVTGIFGLLQPIADGLKLLLKEIIIPKNANIFLFLFAPVLVLLLSLYIWLFLPLSKQLHNDFNLGLLYILVVGVLEIYGIMLAGWSSNSKYALLGGLRSTAQMISYEISLSFIILGIIFLAGSFNLTDIIIYQVKNNLWLIFPLLPFSVIFLISMLAETNRAPFDLPEAEAEIVAGYNVEYSGFLFALFFLGEYSNMLFLSCLFTVFFLGGGSLVSLIGFTYTSIFAGKSLLILFFFIWIRATLPRYRYDQLMTLGWKVFLPLTFGYLTFLISYLYFFNIFPTKLLF